MRFPSTLHFVALISDRSSWIEALIVIGPSEIYISFINSEIKVKGLINLSKIYIPGIGL